jgi:hypothetical protein
MTGSDDAGEVGSCGSVEVVREDGPCERSGSGDDVPFEQPAGECETDLQPLIEGEQDLDDPTQDKYQGLEADTSRRFQPRVRTFIDLQQVKAAKDHITRLPEVGETQHAIISGRYPLFAMVPAVCELAGCDIDELWLVTLSYGRDNAADLLEMLDDGRIKKTWLMVSHYFAAANAHLYDPLAAALIERGQRVLALRTHAKIILFRLADGRRYVVESSANLRSCKNIEQWAFTRDDDLFQFHRDWIAGLFEEAAKKDEGAAVS